MAKASQSTPTVGEAWTQAKSKLFGAQESQSSPQLGVPGVEESDRIEERQTSLQQRLLMMDEMDAQPQPLNRDTEAK